VRIALLRQPSTTLATVLAFLPELTVSDLRELAAPGVLPENLCHYLQAEIRRRLQKPKLPSDGVSEDPGANSGK
jgi:hypothetical protein